MRGVDVLGSISRHLPKSSEFILRHLEQLRRALIPDPQLADHPVDHPAHRQFGGCHRFLRRHALLKEEREVRGELDLQLVAAPPLLVQSLLAFHRIPARSLPPAHLR